MIKEAYMAGEAAALEKIGAAFGSSWKGMKGMGGAIAKPPSSKIYRASPATTAAQYGARAAGYIKPRPYKASRSTSPGKVMKTMRV